MKRCPQCNRVESDEALKFCRVDGATLVSESASLGSNAATGQIGPDASEVHTSILPHSTSANATRATGPTTVLPAHQEPSTTAELTKPKRHKPMIVGAVLLIVSIAVGGYFYLTGKRARTIDSVAVLPFQNAGGDKETEFLADGISETLINNFTKISALRVTARSTAFRYKGKEIEPQQVGRELNVGAILTGKVLQRGGSLSIQVDLINAADGSQIWGNRYDGKAAEILDLQERLARDVSASLKWKLSGAQEQQIAKNYTHNADAYQLYLKGRFYWNRRTAENLKKAIAEFQAAADKDPNYALAFAGLADCYALLNEYSGVPVAEAAPQAKTYAERAIAIDESLAEPHATLGTVNVQMWQWVEAEKEFKRAIELNSNYATAYHWYSITLLYLGRKDESLAIIQRAREIDPMSSIITSAFAWVQQMRGDHQASIENLLKLIEFDPNFGITYATLGLSYLKTGRNAEAVAALEKAAQLNRYGITLGNLGYVYAVTGKRTEALAVIKELKEKYARKETNGQSIASVYAGLGDKDKAFEWLEKDFQNRDGLLPGITVSIPLESLRDDPRFKELLKRMNLPE